MNHDDPIFDDDDYVHYARWRQRTIKICQWHCFFPSGEKVISWEIEVSGKNYCKAARVYRYLLEDIRRSSRAKAGMPCGVDVWLDDKQIEPVIKHGRMHVGPHGRLV